MLMYNQSAISASNIKEENIIGLLDQKKKPIILNNGNDLPCMDLLLLRQYNQLVPSKV